MLEAPAVTHITTLPPVVKSFTIFGFCKLNKTKYFKYQSKLSLINIGHIKKISAKQKK